MGKLKILGELFKGRHFRPRDRHPVRALVS
jgi:hypothetical protein